MAVPKHVHSVNNVPGMRRERWSDLGGHLAKPVQHVLVDTKRDGLLLGRYDFSVIQKSSGRRWAY